MTISTASRHKRWQVYIVRCADETLYTGVARNAARRVAEHNEDGARGAKYTRPRRPVTLIYVEEADSRSAACRREHAIKSLRRHAKLELIASAAASRAARRRRARRRYP